jgi:TPR repeat protein
MNPTYRTNTNLDRRRTFRKVPEKFAFIQLERDDGGAVLNVSEGGLSFNTFAPVLQNGPIHFWFSLNLNERIDAWGEVTWTDDSKKVGGLRFIRLPERAGRQIREWISRAVAQQAPEEKRTPQAVGGRPSRIVPREPDAVARFVSKARSQRSPIVSRGEDSRVSNMPFSPLGEIEPTAGLVPKPRLRRSPILSSGILSGSEDSVDSNASVLPSGEMVATGELVPMERFRSAKRRQLILGLLLGISISATAGIAAIKYSNRRHESTGPAAVSSASTAQKNGGQALPPIPVSPSAASGSSVDIFGSSNRKTGVSGTNKAKVLAEETGGHPVPNKWGSPVSNLPAQSPVATSLSGKASQKKVSATPQQLWASVQAGNSSASVALAELYIKGEGVPQNCNQARVLLLVASEKRNAAAIKRLAELDKTGCPAN